MYLILQMDSTSYFRMFMITEDFIHDNLSTYNVFKFTFSLKYLDTCSVCLFQLTANLLMLKLFTLKHL